MICFDQVSPTDEVWNVVFGVFWKAAWCHHVWTSIVDGWEHFRGEQHFSRMCFWILTTTMMFLETVWNFFCLAWCICSTTTTSKLHVISNRFCMMMFFGDGFREAFISGLASFCRILEYAFATCANACGSGWLYFSLCFSWNLQQTLENNVHVWGSRGAPFGEGTLSPLRRYLKPLPKGGRGGRGGVSEEPKPP